MLFRSCIQCDAREWDALAVLAGEAEVQAATADEFIPQMLNYDVSGHVSFTKGCYTGQEVVARLHYRGTAKRRAFPVMLGGGIETDQLVGSDIYVDQNTQSVGKVAGAGIKATGETVALAVLTRKLLDGPGFSLGSPDGPQLKVLAAPYTLPD